MFFKKKVTKVEKNESLPKKRNFIIPEIINKSNNDGFIEKKFASSIFGSNVKDDTVIPEIKEGISVDKKYDAFRSKRVLNNFDEFTKVNSSNSKESLGRDTREYCKTDDHNKNNNIKVEVEEIDIPYGMSGTFEYSEMDLVSKQVKENEILSKKRKLVESINEIEEDIIVEETKKEKVEEETVIKNFGFGSFNKKNIEEEHFAKNVNIEENIPDYENLQDNSYSTNSQLTNDDEEISYCDNDSCIDINDMDENTYEDEISNNEIAPLKVQWNDEIEEEEIENDFDEPEEVEEDEPRRLVITEELSKVYTDYIKPPIDLLNTKELEENLDNTWASDKANTLNMTLEQFKIDGKVSQFQEGPSVTRFEVVLGIGVQVKKITSLEDTIKMNLAATDIRIEAPIPGKNAVGIEIPNLKRRMVQFGSVINSDEFYENGALSIGLGLDIDGNRVFTDIGTMPHGLIAGSTGSGKSVCINTLIISLIMKNSPKDLRLLLIDPKMVELVSYNNLPHLVTPVISDPKMASQGLKWAVEEMERRYRLFADNSARNLSSYNKKAETDDYLDHIPYIVIIVDELADLMMIAGQDVEDSIQRITQKARAAGIHLLVATQRPSTDVVKGTIKTNIPSRIAFSVATYVDSMTIIDRKGAETLLGKGDMLIIENGKPSTRVQGAYLSDDEIDGICDFIRAQGAVKYLFEKNALMAKNTKVEAGDELLQEVAYFVVSEDTASMNRISKNFSVGFNRAQSIIEMLATLGVVGPRQNSKAREILLSKEELDKIFNK